MKTGHSNRVMAWALGLTVGTGLLAVLWSSDGWAKEAASPPKLDDYAIIVNENMFSKNRQPPRDLTRVRPPTIEPNEESFYILSGIGRDESTGQSLVFLLDNKHGGWVQKRVGEDIARGKIKSVSMDMETIEYQMGEKTRTIQMKQDLEGGKGAIRIRDVQNILSGPRPQGGEVQGGGPRGGGMQGGRNRQDQFGNSGRFNRQQDQFGNRNRNMGGQSITRTPTTSTSSSSGDTLTGDAAQMLRLMMERRQRELGQPVQSQPAQGEQPSGQDQPQPGQDQQQSGQGQQ